MSRKEFMERLEKLLEDISDSEREEALQYYNDYFDDAGVENEAEVIRELVSPEQVAQKIKAFLIRLMNFPSRDTGIRGLNPGTENCLQISQDRNRRKKRRTSGRCWRSCCSAFLQRL